VTPETFSHYKELASSNLKSGNPDMALTLYRECIYFLKKTNENSLININKQAFIL